MDNPTPETLTFDQKVCERLRLAFADVFLNHPEVKCLSVVVGWNGGLNEAVINHGVWLAADGGPVKTGDGLVVSLFQTLRMLDTQVGRLRDYVKTQTDRVHVLGGETVKKHEELEAIEKQIETRRAELAALGGG